MVLRGVIFDMGGTLLDYHPPGSAFFKGWEGMEHTGAAGLHSYLAAQGYPLPALEAARQTNLAIVQRHWIGVMRGDQPNARLADILAEVLAEWGVPAADGLITAAVAAYTARIQEEIVQPMEGAGATLAALQARGLRLGLVSNTVWPGEAHLHDLARYGLAEYLEVALFSSDAGAWKPRPAIFRRALAALDLAPQEAAYVGDNLFADVYGAQGAGLKGIWLEGDRELPPGFSEPVVPDATITRLPELLDVIARF